MECGTFAPPGWQQMHPPNPPFWIGIGDDGGGLSDGELPDGPEALEDIVVEPEVRLFWYEVLDIS
jgi:hypothetical protein